MGAARVSPWLIHRSADVEDAGQEAVGNNADILGVGKDHIDGRAVQAPHTAEVDFSRRGQLEFSADGPRRNESQQGRYQTILAIKCTVVPSVSGSMVTSCISARMSVIPRPR